MIRRAVDVVVSATMLVLASPVLVAAVVAIRLESRGSAIYRQRRTAWGGRPFEVIKLRTMVTGAEKDWGRPLNPRGRPADHARGGAAAAHVARRAAEPAERAARRDVADRSPPHPAGAGRVPTPPGSADASRCARGSPAGRRSTAACRCRGASGSSSISSTSSTARSCARPAHRVAHGGDRVGRLGPVQGRGGRLEGGWEGWIGSARAPPSGVRCAGKGACRGGGGRVRPVGWCTREPSESTGASPAILLTGVGKRYESSRASRRSRRPWRSIQTPLAPAQYAAQVRTTAPADADSGYVPALQGAARAVRDRRGGPAHRPRYRGASLTPARRGLLPALVPSPEVARATYDKYEAHLLLTRLGLPSPAHGAARRGAFEWPTR